MGYWSHFHSQVRKRRRYVCLLFTLAVLGLIYIDFNISNVYQHQIGSSNYRTILPQTITRNPRQQRQVILLWTTFFGGMEWFTESKDVFTKTSRDCILTNNKSEIASADVLVFHLNDIAWYGSPINGFGVQLPKYHKPNQLWVLYNLEPLSSIWFDATHWGGVFNWTMSYNIDSDVPVPYGEFSKLSHEEQLSTKASLAGTGFKYYDAHPKHGGIAMISNCIDNARRYRIIEKLQKYIDIKVIGRCGERSTMHHGSENKLLHAYKFYLALENSDCEHYVTEKYWRTLERHQIPIVAWRNNMSDIVIPGSYINVFDFRDLEEAGKHIADVDKNDTLYHGYFDWMYTYTIAYKNGWCKLCDAIHHNVTHMYYSDINGWLHDDTCDPLTASNILHRIYDRFTYDWRLY